MNENHKAFKGPTFLEMKSALESEMEELKK